MTEKILKCINPAVDIEDGIERVDDLLYLAFEIRGKQCLVNLQRKGKMIGAYEEYKIADLSRRLTSKKSGIVQEIMVLIDGCEDPTAKDAKLLHKTAKRIRKICGEVQDEWLSDYNPPIRQVCPPKIFSQEQQNEAISWLMQDGLLEDIIKEVQRKVAGEEDTIAYVYLKFIQGLTDYYDFVNVIAPSATGKTFIIEEIVWLIPEHLIIYIIGLSPTALRKWKKNKTGRIMVVNQKDGTERSTYLLNMMHSRDKLGKRTKAVYLVTNPETGEVDEETLPDMMVIVTGVRDKDTEEEETRYSATFFDDTEEQTDRILRKDEEKKYTEETRMKKGYLKPSEEDKYRCAFNILNEIMRSGEIHGEVIPFWDKIVQQLDRSKVRVREDKNKIREALGAIALLNIFKRDIMQEGDKNYIVVTVEDWQYFLKYCLKHTFQSFFRMNKRRAIIVEVIKENTKEMVLHTNRIVCGVYTQDLVDILTKKLNIRKTAITDELKNMYNQGILDRERVERETAIKTPEKGWAEENRPTVTKRGYYYSVPEIERNMIKVNQIKIEDLQDATKEWYEEMQSDEIGNSFIDFKTFLRIHTVRIGGLDQDHKV